MPHADVPLALVSLRVVPDPPPEPPAGGGDEATFRSVFRDHAARVAVVTAVSEPGARPVGFTATSLVSVSVRPPMVSFTLARGSGAWAVLGSSDRVAVHLLADDQADVARIFATTGLDKFAAVPWTPGPSGEALLDGCGGYLLGRITDRVHAGDNVMVLAEVDDAWVARAGAPLLYHNGRYTSVVPRPRPPHVVDDTV